ncbi:2-isopropylmalate synthase [Marispirochaeta aestuarii]|uniref:2-isopropylmalate synthase n=2 Tax=Marispirochaeta aestuarii TaxID=1963862 RepID=A0A1Y1RX92_9SPIO|nr:2-isopropylmalate synthase [Marispirochaeta aestuarii]
MNYTKYRRYEPIPLPDRTWPDRIIEKAPIWCSVDLRDGNQALSVPMNMEKKLMMFKLLTDIGFKEIEVGFPSSAEIEYNFMRKLIEDKLIPEDVTVQVLVQAREHLIRRTFDSLKGVKNAVVHIYNSTSTSQRRLVFKKSRKEIIDIAVSGARLVKELGDAEENPGIRYEYSPESFTGTEMDFAAEICNAVIDVLQPTPDHQMVINLPATVEAHTPNIHADQIEWMCRHLDKRDSVQVSLHTHNDRGTGIAATELALLAGADRVEGTLFGNGERTGNADLVTIALNMFSQGIDPGLDFTDINYVRDVYRYCTGMDVHPRHPYVGELVYTAFSGSHQDAINKGMHARTDGESQIWDVPYLPIDPRDVGRSYKSIVRINSQSGKGGVAYIMDTEFGFSLPKAMHPEFGLLIQKETDKREEELVPEEIWAVFEENYLNTTVPFALEDVNVRMETDKASGKHMANVTGKILKNGKALDIEGRGNGPIDAFVHGLKQYVDFDFQFESFDEHAIKEGADAQAVAYISVITGDNRRVFGAGIDTDITFASYKAILSAINRVG